METNNLQLVSNDSPPIIAIPDHASYSHFNAVATCPLRWYFKYIEHRPEKKKGAQFLGLTCHEVIDRVHRNKATIQQIPDTYHDAWMSQAGWVKVQEDGTITGFVPWEEIHWIDDLKNGTPQQNQQRAEDHANKMYAYGLKLCQAYFSGPHRRNTPGTLICPNGHHQEPLSEFELNVDLRPYGAKRIVNLNARLDLLTDDGRLIDFKTKNYRRIPEKQILTDLQPVIYAWALSEMDIIHPPLKFAYGQLVYAQKQGEFYDETLKRTIEPWEVDVMRQLVVPGLVEQVEELLDKVMNLEDHAKYFKSRIRPGDHCGWCDFQEFCPKFNPEAV